MNTQQVKEESKIIKKILDIDVLRTYLGRNGYAWWSRHFLSLGIKGAKEPSIKCWVNEDKNMAPKREMLFIIAKENNVDVSTFFKDRTMLNDIEREVLDSILNEAQELDLESSKIIYIPFYKDLTVSAGTGIEVFETDKVDIPFLKDEIMAHLEIRKVKELNELALFPMIGDSMKPTINEGSSLVVKRLSNIPVYGAIYVLFYEDKYYVKRVVEIDDKLFLRSDNKEDYKDKEVLPDRNFSVLGMVVGIYNYDFKKLC